MAAKEIEEMVVKLRERVERELEVNEVIELCFKVILQHPDPIEQSRAAVILSGIVVKGLGRRTRQFLDENPQLPARVHEILGAAIMRMECF